jgi:hypothetical protein
MSYAIETLAHFVSRLGLYRETRFQGQPHECQAVIVPWNHRPEAFELSDYLVSTSVSGDFLEFMPRGAWPFTSR